MNIGCGFDWFVIDLNFLEEGVWYVEVILVDPSVEWISKRVCIEVVVVSSGNWIVPIFRLVFVWFVGADNYVELVSHTILFAFRKEVPVGETVERFLPVNFEFFFAFVGVKDVLVQLLVGGAITNVIAVLRSTFKYVLTSLEFVVEFVEFHKVQTVFVDVDLAPVLVVFRADEHSHDSFSSFVGVHVNLVGEWFVVETVLAGVHLEMFVFEFLFVGVHGVSDVGIEVVVVGHQFVYFHVFNLETFEMEFFVLVVRKMCLVFLEIQDDFLVEFVEDWVAKGSFEMLQG